MNKFFFPNNKEMLVYHPTGEFVAAYEYPMEEVVKQSFHSHLDLLKFLTGLIREQSPILKPIASDRVESYPIEYFHFQALTHNLQGNA